MATEKTSFEGILPAREPETWAEFRIACERWLESRATKHSHDTTKLGAQLSELTVKCNAIDEDCRRLGAQLAQIEDELKDVSQRLTAKNSEYSSLDEAYRRDVETKHMEWEHQMRVMTNDSREERGDTPFPEDAVIELPPPPSPVSAVAPPPAPKPASPSRQLQDELRARAALDQSARGPSPAESSPPKLPTCPTRIKHWDIISRRDSPPLPPSYRPSQGQHQERLRPHSSTSWPKVENPPDRGVRDYELRQQEQRKDIRNPEIQDHGTLLSSHPPAIQAHSLPPPSRPSRHGWPFDSRNRGHLAVGTPRGSPHPHTRAGHPPLGPIFQESSPALLSAQTLPSLPQQRLPSISALNRQLFLPPDAHPYLSSHKLAHTQHPGSPPPMVPQRPEHQRQQHAPSPHRQPLPVPFTGGFRPVNSGFIPANRPVTSRPQFPLAVTPVMLAQNPPTAPEKPNKPLGEINRRNLVLRHDGAVYTSPQCMVGVPTGKIRPGDPYWEHDWKDVRSEVLDKIEHRRQLHQKAFERWEPGASKSNYYTSLVRLRQSKKIIEFLDDPKQISPYQLLAKQFMNASEGCITSYKTLSCLCETLSELANYDLDIEPLDWMRHRLYEIHLEAPEGSFNLCKILNDFYHDPKLTALRHNHEHKKRRRSSSSKWAGPSDRTSTQPNQ